MGNMVLETSGMKCDTCGDYTGWPNMYFETSDLKINVTNVTFMFSVQVYRVSRKKGLVIWAKQYRVIRL